jgi:CDP-diacylglycerol---serine O-phosphatidyltransferase
MKLFTLPNFITLGNLICGCLGIIMVLNSEYANASILMLMALILDFLDGFVARLLKISSEIGKQLDSLADVVTFGVLPSLIIYKLIENANIQPEYLKYSAFIMAAASALRLAKFNIDTRQSDSFIGLPTPANGMVVATFPFLINDYGRLGEIVNNPWVLIAYVLLFSFLLNAEIPLFALKFKNFSWKDNKMKFIFLIACILLILAFKLAAIPLIILIYILLSIAVMKSKKPIS